MGGGKGVLGGGEGVVGVVEEVRELWEVRE